MNKESFVGGIDRTWGRWGQPSMHYPGIKCLSALGPQPKTLFPHLLPFWLHIPVVPTFWERSESCSTVIWPLL